MRAFIITRVGPRSGSWEGKRQFQICQSAAMAKGHHPRTVRAIELQSGAPLFPKNASVVASLAAGDAIFVPSLSTLADSASERIDGIRALVGRGVSVNVVEGIGGDVGPVLSLLETAFADALRLEAQQEKERAAHRREIAELSESNASFERELVSTIVARYGLPASGIDGLAGLRAETEKKLAVATSDAAQRRAEEAFASRSEEEKAREEDERVGAWLRELREKRGLTLRQAAENVRISAATLSRLETSGRGPSCASYAGFLAPGVEPNAASLRAAAKKHFAQEEADADAGEKGEPQHAATESVAA